MSAFFLHAWDILLRFMGAGAGLLGGGDLTMLCALMILDYGTGLALGALGKSKKSKDGRLTFQAALLGLLQKVVMICVILLAGGLVMLAGIVQACVFYRCPHCKKSLMYICGPHNNCPHCGGELFGFDQ